MIFLGALSFLAAIYFHRDHPDMVFFLAPFRVFQFAIGGLISFIPAWHFRDRLSIVGVSSVVLLFVLAAILPDDLAGFNHVFLVMLVPALLTGAFIFTAYSNIQEKIFSSPIFKYLGQRSYAIYLAHWPIIVYWNMATDYELNILEQVGLFFASVICGEFLHQLIEKPFRLSKTANAARVLRTKLFLLAMAFLGTTLAVNVIYFSGFGDNNSNELAFANNAPLAENIDSSGAQTSKGRCFMRQEDTPDSYGVERCATGPEGQLPRVLVFGDSFAGDMYVALKGGFNTPYFAHYVIPGCPLESPSQVAGNKNKCQAHYKHAYENVITKDRFDYVALVANWTGVSDAEMQEVQQHLETLGIKVVVIGLRPRFRERVPDIFAKLEDKTAAIERANSIIVSDFMERAKDMRDVNFKDIRYVDTMAILCPDTCVLETPNGDLLYRDDSHFTLKGSSYVGREIQKAYPDLFK